MKSLLQIFNFNKSVKQNNTTILERANLWSYESMRILLGFHDIQKKIISHYFPELNQITLGYFGNNQEQSDEILHYCEKIITNDDLTGTHIVSISDKQLLVIDKMGKNLYIVDPTGMLRIKSIYNTEFLDNIVIPLFETHYYHCEYVMLEYPAVCVKKGENNEHPRTWLLYILMDCLQQLEFNHTIDPIFIPSSDYQKTKIIQNFYSEIVCIPEIRRELEMVYLETVGHNGYLLSVEELSILLDMNPTNIITKRIQCKQ